MKRILTDNTFSAEKARIASEHVRVANTINEELAKTRKILEENANKKRKSIEYIESISKKVAKEIKTACEHGLFETKIVLEEHWNHKFPTSSFEFDEIIRELVKDLRAEFYEVYYGYDTVCHDTSFDYLNSGGECGSSTPRYEDVLVLKISWKD